LSLIAKYLLVSVFWRRVRMLVSASIAGSLFDLRCDVREGIVRWLQATEPGALPRRRIEPASTPGDGIAHDVTPVVSRADSALFSGSPGAEQRGRAFDGPDAEDDRSDRREFAAARSRAD
jgi:hypothetical protein